MVKSLITLENVGLRYRKRKSLFRHDYYQALKSISLSLSEGDVLGIIGKNGCGKSTLLKVLAGIYKHDTGFLYREPGLRVSLLSLQAGFDQQLSGVDNAIFNSMLLGIKKKEAKNKVREIIEFAELEEFSQEPLKTYSTGMRARLGFSIAMNINPDVLLIDETLSVGDAGFRKKAEAALIEKLSGIRAVVIVSHMAAQMEKLCTKAIWIEHGEIQAEGSAEEVVRLYSAA